MMQKKQNAMTQKQGQGQRYTANKLARLDSVTSVNAAPISSKETACGSTVRGSNSSIMNSSKQTVSLDQIRELEQKIASLNEHIATMMNRDVKTQEDIVNAQAEALQESQMVQSDETLGWKLSFIDMPQEASHLFTPKSKFCAMSRQNSQQRSGAGDTDKRQQNDSNILQKESTSKQSAKTDELLRSAFLNPHINPQHHHQLQKSKKVEHGVMVRSFEDDNVFMEQKSTSIAAAQQTTFFPAALSQIKKVVSAFVGKLGLPFCVNRKQVEDELSRSITQALIDASDDSIQNQSSRILDLSSISATLQNSQQQQAMLMGQGQGQHHQPLSSEQLEYLERALAKGLSPSGCGQMHQQDETAANASTTQFLLAAFNQELSGEDSQLIGKKRGRNQANNSLLEHKQKQEDKQKQVDHDDSGYLTFSEDEIVTGSNGWTTLNGCRRKAKTQRKQHQAAKVQQKTQF